MASIVSNPTETKNESSVDAKKGNEKGNISPLVEATISEAAVGYDVEVAAENAEDTADIASDSDDSDMDGLGFMFDNLQATKSSTYTLPLPLCEGSSKDQMEIRVSIEAIDDNPGACISGHYLWPASMLMANHLVNNRLDYQGYNRALEVGSGSGMGGIVTALIGGGEVVMTDHDHGVLKRCERNTEITDEVGGEGQKEIKGRCKFQEVRWGNKVDIDRVGEGGRFDLVVGADVIYSSEVVGILYETVGGVMEEGGVFLMAQSFVYDEDTEREIEKECEKRGWKRNVLFENWEEEGEGERGKIQTFGKKA
ncbi:hypothetical protein TrCOL_g11387 [Triparma columacea]|uniref:Uncharacterized protein n=1 Tax=Triparma columacea TaxID=722753 RepID=A0A9W7L1N9_9STRA|nr:hypothetical protein TrCOL_g11387 [Triparma columacea]